MSSRRVDVIYISVFIVAVGIAWLATRQGDGEPPGEVEIPPLSTELEHPPVALPEPNFVFRPLSRYESPGLTRPRFGDRMESALVEVRSSLLASAIRNEAARAD